MANNYDPYMYDPYMYDPNAGYYDAGYYDPYGYEPQVEETASAKLRKQEELLLLLENNRLFLQKFRKQCIKEDYADLEQKVLFLVEVLIEKMEVNSESSLSLTSPEEEDVYVTVKVQFCNSPYLEITENISEPNESSSLYEDQLNYMRALGEDYDVKVSGNNTSDEGNEAEDDSSKSSVDCDIEWTSATGKSCLMPMGVFEMVQNLVKFPVNIEVERCAGQGEDGGPASREPLAYASVRLPDEVVMTILESVKPGGILPTTSVYSQTCDLRNVYGVLKGRAKVLVRLTTFGPVIISSVKSTDTGKYYVLDPSTMAAPAPEREHAKADVLKPLISEEENTVGITIRQEPDIFKRPVLWKSGEASESVVCPEVQEPRQTASDLDSDPLIRMPLSSGLNLCRDIASPERPAVRRRFGNRFCDWHNLVALEVTNSPVGNCGRVSGLSGKVGCEAVLGRGDAKPPEQKGAAEMCPSQYVQECLCSCQAAVGAGRFLNAGL